MNKDEMQKLLDETMDYFDDHIEKTKCPISLLMIAKGLNFLKIPEESGLSFDKISMLYCSMVKMNQSGIYNDETLKVVAELILYYLSTKNVDSIVN